MASRWQLYWIGSSSSKKERLAFRRAATPGLLGISDGEEVEVEDAVSPSSWLDDDGSDAEMISRREESCVEGICLEGIVLGARGGTGGGSSRAELRGEDGGDELCRGCEAVDCRGVEESVSSERGEENVWRIWTRTSCGSDWHFSISAPNLSTSSAAVGRLLRSIFNNIEI